MTTNGTAPAGHPADWPQAGWTGSTIAKGICIIMVVMMHSTLGVEAAAGREGFMHAVVEFAKPFRMPDFFLISGLFLARVIDRDWRTYIDRKVVHFAYFYVLWVTLQFAVKAPSFAAEHGWANVAGMYLLSFIEPFGTLWFIYLLPIFFVVTKLTQRVPVAADLDRRRGTRDGADPHRLDRDRRIRLALRLLLFGLPARQLCLHVRTRGAGRMPRRAGRPRHVGAGQWRRDLRRRRRLAADVAGVRLCRMRRDRHRQRAAGKDAPARRDPLSAASTRWWSISRSSCRWPPRASCW